MGSKSLSECRLSWENVLVAAFQYDGIASNAGGYALSCTSKMSQNNTFMNGFYIIDIWHDVFVVLNVSKKSVLRRELLPVLFVPSVFGNGNYHNYRSGGGG